MSREPSLEVFLKDVASHVMHVERNEGLYRHLRFRRPGTYCMGFDIHTWPGYLCYCGDMGTYVFSRLPDMFEFFRGEKINPHYWDEKVEAADRNGGITEYREELFRKRVCEWMDESEDMNDEIRAAVHDEILNREFEGEHEARRSVYLFEHDGFRFRDFWEINLHEYTNRFIWCCYALVWGIQQYDLSKAPTVEATDKT